MHITVRERRIINIERIESAVAELKPALAAYARDHGGRFILFGSAARREMRPDSDVDIYVDFPAGPHMGAIGFAEEAAVQLGLKPDILGFGRPAGRLLARLEQEGLVLPGDEERWSRPMANKTRWDDVLETARSAAAHFRAAERIFQRGGVDDMDEAGYEMRMALYHAMQSAHTALESALRRSLIALGQQPPSGADWHKQLLVIAASQCSPNGCRLLGPESAAAASETLGFRHFVSHAYDAPFVDHRALPAVLAGRFLADRIEAEISAFVEDINVK